MISVPAGNRLTGAVTTMNPGGGLGFQPIVNLVVGACAQPLRCVAGIGGTGGTATTTWDNVGTGTVTVMILVDTAAAVVGSTYTLTTSVAPVTLPPGDVCGNTTAPITVDTMLTAQSLVGYGNNFTTGTTELGCTFGDGPDRVYAVTLPANTRLTTTATSPTANLSVSVVDGPAAACLANPLLCGASIDATFTGPEAVRFDNNTAAPRTVFVIVDRTAGTLATDTFDLALSLTPTPTFVAGGESCGAPVVIGPNTAFTSTTTGLTNDYVAVTAANCKNGSTAPDSVFQVTIPTNSRFTVTTVATWDMTLNVIGAPVANCGTGMGTGMTCLGSSDGITGTETVTINNTALTPLVVFVLIDGWQSTQLGSFELTTTTILIPPPAYTKTTIAQACQGMTGATALLGPATTPLISDDAVSGTLALPFAFTFFGAAQTHYAVTNNGLLQFFTSAAGIGDSDYANTPIPTSVTPNGFAAPFWDDLYPTGTTVIQTITSGTAPNRKMTVEWFDASFYPSARPERLQFQAQLYETSNVIEFHYCNLAPGAGSLPETTGASATIGLENAAGTDGVQHSTNTASAVSTANALRFTP